MKMKLVSSLIVSFIFTAQSVFASTAGSINSTGIAEAVNSVNNASYGSQRAARCSGRRFSECIKAAAGFAQTIQSLMTMMGSMGSRDSLSPGTLWGTPGFETQIGPIATEDREFFDPILNAIESGNLTDYEKARNEILNRMQPDIDKLAGQGVTFDAAAGTITTPTGTQNLSDLGPTEPGGRFDDYMSKTLAALGDTSGGGGMISVDAGAGGGGGDRGLASVGPGSSVDNFLNKLDKGQLDSNKLVGMSKNTKDGDAIGVAMGNLFKTVHVKYKSLNTKNEFK